ncbi:hypothetical protein EDB85DRAFT_1888156 [Lactarius pseudohatsudake]|nr:hypothetical protein EDB85DRAFT_1888156 [Lactarius pseudohatsudake]
MTLDSPPLGAGRVREPLAPARWTDEALSILRTIWTTGYKPGPADEPPRPVPVSAPVVTGPRIQSIESTSASWHRVGQGSDALEDALPLPREMDPIGCWLKRRKAGEAIANALRLAHTHFDFFIAMAVIIVWNGFYSAKKTRRTFMEWRVRAHFVRMMLLEWNATLAFMKWGGHVAVDFCTEDGVHVTTHHWHLYPRSGLRSLGKPGTMLPSSPLRHWRVAVAAVIGIARLTLAGKAETRRPHLPRRRPHCCLAVTLPSPPPTSQLSPLHCITVAVMIGFARVALAECLGGGSGILMGVVVGYHAERLRAAMSGNLTKGGKAKPTSQWITDRTTTTRDAFWMDGWHGVTPKAIVTQIVERCRCDVVLDAFCDVASSLCLDMM